MRENDRWLLPEGIEELLPPEADQLEKLRRQLLDMFATWGYELVMPPFIEYLESLLIGTGNQLDLQTFKLTDQLTGRLMGVRADITPQVARIDAHHWRRAHPSRLCYIGTVLHTRPEVLGGSRSPLQVGAELYGHSGPESDLEILSLMMETLQAAGVRELYLDLGHVAIFRALAGFAGLSGEVEARLFDALQRKARPEIEQMLAEADIADPARGMLAALADLNGGAEVLERAHQCLAAAPPAVTAALAELKSLADALQRHLPGLPIHFDLAELRGYHYHTGVVFAAYVPGRGLAVAQGGRYDGIGAVFGVSERPATGFSTDLKTLWALSPATLPEVHGIFAPWNDDADLELRIRELRGLGERVVRALPGQQGGAAEMGCDRKLVRQDDQWQVVPAAEN